MMINQIIPSVNLNYWLQRFDTACLKPTNHSLRKLPTAFLAKEKDFVAMKLCVTVLFTVQCPLHPRRFNVLSFSECFEVKSRLITCNLVGNV